MPYIQFSMLFEILALAVTLLAADASASCGQSLKVEVFLSAVNRELQRVPYQRKVASSHVVCVSYCHADPQCHSVNYNLNNYICGLHNGTRAWNRTDNFIPHYGSVYFDGDVETPHLALPDYGFFTSAEPDTTLSTTASKNANCQDLRDGGQLESSNYTIFPAGFENGLQVYCDMETDGEGWIVIQRREDGSVDFYRTWADYRLGFGNLSGEFWLGNDNLRALTESTHPWSLRVDLENWHNDKVSPEYGLFKVSGDNFTLHIGSFDDSVARDSLKIHNGMMFSTKDRDNDAGNVKCAKRFHGAWWYKGCYYSNLNGMYYNNESTHDDGLIWNTWNDKKPVKKCSMKIRPSVPIAFN